MATLSLNQKILIFSFVNLLLYLPHIFGHCIIFKTKTQHLNMTRIPIIFPKSAVTNFEAPSSGPSGTLLWQHFVSTFAQSPAVSFEIANSTTGWQGRNSSITSRCFLERGAEAWGFQWQFRKLNTCQKRSLGHFVLRCIAKGYFVMSYTVLYGVFAASCFRRLRFTTSCHMRHLLLYRQLYLTE